MSVWAIERKKMLMELVEKYKSEGLKGLEIFEKISNELQVSNATAIRAQYYRIINSGGVNKNEVKKKIKKEHKPLIIEHIISIVEDGKRIKEAVQDVAKEFEYTYEQCYQIWKSAKNVKRTRERNVWTLEEDELLVNTVLEYHKQGIPVTEAAKLAAKTLNRSINSCSGRWTNVLQEKHLDSIELAYEHWDEGSDLKLLNIVSRETNNGKKLKEAFKIAGKELNRTVPAISARYNIMDKNRLEHNIHLGHWLSEEEEKLKEIMFNGAKENKKVKDLFELASKELHKTDRSIYCRWYYYILPTCKEEYAEIRTVKNGRLKFGEKSPRINWTSEEKELLLKTIEEFDNISEACHYVSEILEHRTYVACVNRYQKLKNKKVG